MSYGLDTTLAISFQNSYGTSLTSSRFWIPFISEGFAVTKEMLVEGNMTGRFDEGQHYEGVNANDGSIEAEANPQALGALFKAFFGAPTTSASGTALKNHLYKPTTSDFDKYAAKIPCTITKYLGDGGSAHLYYDMVASKLALSIANGELLKCNVEFVGGKYSQVAAAAASLPSNKGWTWDVTSVSIGTSAQTGLRDLNINIEEGIEGKHFLGNAKTPGRIKRNGARTTTVGGTIVFDNQDEYQQFLSQTERELVVTLKGITVIQSGYYDTLEIKIPQLRYTEFKPVAGGAEEIEVGFSAKAIYSTASATAIQVTLTNTQAAY